MCPLTLRNGFIVKLSSDRVTGLFRIDQLSFSFGPCRLWMAREIARLLLVEAVLALPLLQALPMRHRK